VLFFLTPGFGAEKSLTYKREILFLITIVTLKNH
jgi:hypothetical protein